MKERERYIVIGIAGGFGSGKTTFCSNLAKNLDVVTVLTIFTDDLFLRG
ncbi:P-loop NTPase fold protein [Bacillus sp. 2205SS5-2]